ncbi:unnamed protein product [Prorocentrum cordatum]|uniref:Uncharacterized protein n=1 Tax=Prorocentrum cordatum TaxID=2364126 RepID=A0ABN9UDF7_9DINO|nr:unnamed protein product [Polarella glacialis]
MVNLRVLKTNRAGSIMRPSGSKDKVDEVSAQLAKVATWSFGLALLVSITASVASSMALKSSFKYENTIDHLSTEFTEKSAREDEFLNLHGLVRLHLPQEKLKAGRLYVISPSQADLAGVEQDLMQLRIKILKNVDFGDRSFGDGDGDNPGGGGPPAGEQRGDQAAEDYFSGPHSPFDPGFPGGEDPASEAAAGAAAHGPEKFAAKVRFFDERARDEREMRAAQETRSEPGRDADKKDAKAGDKAAPSGGGDGSADPAGGGDDASDTESSEDEEGEGDQKKKKTKKVETDPIDAPMLKYPKVYYKNVSGRFSDHLVVQILASDRTVFQMDTNRFKLTSVSEYLFSAIAGFAL